MSDTMLMLVVAEVTPRLKDHAGDLKSALRVAMLAAKDHWMVLDQDTQFRGAVAAVMKHYGQGSEEWARLEWEVGQIRRFSAALTAAAAGLGVDLGDALDSEPPYEAVGLVGMWREIAR